VAERQGYENCHQLCKLPGNFSLTLAIVVCTGKKSGKAWKAGKSDPLISRRLQRTKNISVIININRIYYIILFFFISCQGKAIANNHYANRYIDFPVEGVAECHMQTKVYAQDDGMLWNL